MEWTDDFACPQGSVETTLPSSSWHLNWADQRFTMWLAPPTSIGEVGQPFTADFYSLLLSNTSNEVGGVTLSSMTGAICCKSGYHSPMLGGRERTSVLAWILNWVRKKRKTSRRKSNSLFHYEWLVSKKSTG